MAADPNNPTFPGVYILEVPSQVRAITGVPTSITAFIGRALHGPVNTPTAIFSMADFERQFGGVWKDALLGYAVKDFFQNGGGQALVVRLFKKTDASDGTTIIGTTAAQDPVNPASLRLQASSPGSWSQDLGFRIEHPAAVDAGVLASLGEGIVDADVFHLVIGEIGGVDVGGNSTIDTPLEQHLNLTVKESTRRVDRVLAESSDLLVAVDLPSDRPPAGTYPDEPRTAAPTTELVAGDDGVGLDDNSFIQSGSAAAKEGLYALEKADIFNLLYIPPYAMNADPADVGGTVLTEAAAYCKTRRAVLLIDGLQGWGKLADVSSGVSSVASLVSAARDYTALYFPWLKKADPMRGFQTARFPPGGTVAGIIARTDATRGVWKAPAGLDAAMGGVTSLDVPLTDDENGVLNPRAVNCLRTFPAAGHVVWGSRTLAGDDYLASQWKYLPIRRLALYIEESLYRGTQWVVFEPNDEPLWAQIRLNIGAFMHGLFRKGAFQGQTPRDAYVVKCDKETTTQADIDRGIVNILVGFAPLKPAEFVIIRIQQLAGQTEV
jgi:phage tail sheath protein FI